jgi:ribonuclease HII
VVKISTDLLMDDAELLRLQDMLVWEKVAKKTGYQAVAGIDEVGRGPLAGPVVAAACILPSKVHSKTKSKPPLFPGLNDSKKVSVGHRQRLYDSLVKHPHVNYGIGIIDHLVIDAVNIFQATLQAMFKAIEALVQAFRLLPDLLLVDGLNLKHPSIESWKLVKGDELSQSIAAASIIAKVTRDRMMEEYDLIWPEYGFKNHKGYGTKYHLAAIEKHGPCPIHRRSFSPFNLEMAVRDDKESGSELNSS